MNTATPQPILTQQGILFTVVVDSVGRNCIVTPDALLALSHLQTIDESSGDALDLFHAYQAKISGVARRLIAAGVSGDPLRINSATFGAPHTA